MVFQEFASLRDVDTSYMFYHGNGKSVAIVKRTKEKEEYLHDRRMLRPVGVTDIVRAPR